MLIFDAADDEDEACWAAVIFREILIFRILVSISFNLILFNNSFK